MNFELLCLLRRFYYLKPNNIFGLSSEASAQEEIPQFKIHNLKFIISFYSPTHIPIFNGTSTKVVVWLMIKLTLASTNKWVRGARST